MGRIFQNQLTESGMGLAPKHILCGQDPTGNMGFFTPVCMLNIGKSKKPRSVSNISRITMILAIVD